MNAAEPAACATPRRPAFLARAVDPALIEAALDVARRAPSGVNTQPWKIDVLQHAARDDLVRRVHRQLPALCVQPQAQQRFWQNYRQWPGRTDWPGPRWEQAGGGFLAHADAAFGAGAIQTEQDLHDYVDLYRAPVALVCTIDRALGLGSVLDDGMFLHNVVMAAAVRGLRAEHLPGWKGFGDTVCAAVSAADGDLLVAVLALGHAAPAPGADAVAAPTAAMAARMRAHTHWHD